MRRANDRRDGGPVGLLPPPRERQPLGRFVMNAEAPPITGEDVWVLLAVAYGDRDGRGTGPRDILKLVGAIRKGPSGDGDGLRASLGRLGCAGLVVGADGVHRPAEPVADFFRARTHRRGVRHDHRDLSRLLGLDPDRGAV